MTNQEILATRLAARNAQPLVPREGDWVVDNIGQYDRISHMPHDGKHWQGGGGSYHLGSSGYLSHSGSCAYPLPIEGLTLTDQTKPGEIWFFDLGIVGAGRGKHFEIPERVWKYDGVLKIHKIEW